MQKGNSKTIFFIVIVCFVCALLLSLISTFLHSAQIRAKELDRSKQMMIAAKVLSYDGNFLLLENNQFYPAIYDEEKKILIQGPKKKASISQILQIYKTRFLSRLTNSQGEVFTFQEVNIDEKEYIEKNQKKGYAHLPYKLFYQILPNLPPKKLTEDLLPEGYVFPINGFGLWDAIYGYLAIESNADTVIGTTWYQQAETAGLGANISLPSWQKQFFGKLIFQPNTTGSTNFENAPLGITVIKGKVAENLGTSAKAKSAVDGISGASITGQGVTSAYHSSLAPYRPFLIQARKRFESK